MAEKRVQCKFTVQFNPADPAHREVIDLLNQSGRRKAQFIVNAIQHYLHCSEAPMAAAPAHIDMALVESIIRRILNEKDSSSPAATEAPLSHPQEDFSFNDACGALGEDGLSAIMGSMALFRQDNF